MKVIELLTKIANGEEVPQKIKIEDKTYTLFIDKDTGYHYYKDDERKSFMFSISRLERLNDDVEVIEEQKEETKTTTRESIEALGYACGEIQKCFTNGWEKSLKNKSLNQEDKKIEKIEMVGCNMKVKLLENETFLPTENLQTEFIIGKINEIIDYIMEDK